MKTPVLNVDVPNEDWLNSQIDYAASKGRNRFGVPYMEKITAYFKEGVMIPLDVLKLIPGQRDEQSNARAHDLKAITEIMESTGKLPPMSNGQEYLPFIQVAHNGECWVNEGNHRIMAATNLGWKSLPIEIRYYEGAERKDSILSPSKVIDFQKNFLLHQKRIEKSGQMSM